jgi:exosortase
MSVGSRGHASDWRRPSPAAVTTSSASHERCDPADPAPPTAPARLDAAAFQAGLTIALVAVSFGPNLVNLAWYKWLTEPNYSHGWLVPPIAGLILWKRAAWLRPAPPTDLLSGSSRGRRGRRAWASWVPWGCLVGLLAALAFRAWLYERNEEWLETFGLIPTLGLALGTVGGLAWLRWSWPALLFLIFMVPLPGRADAFLAGPLQTLAAIGAGFLLQLAGLPALVEGNTLVVAGQRLEVARACNGLSMLISLSCLVTAYVLLTNDPPWKKLLLLASAVPIALVSNILRITATAVCYEIWTPEIVDDYAHDFAGYAMMPVGFALVLLQSGLIDLVFQGQSEPSPRGHPPPTARPSA